MGNALVIAPELVREEWQQMESWSPSRAAGEAKRFTRRQPYLAAYAYAMLEEQGLAAISFGMELAHTLERTYRRALDDTPVQIGERDMETAAEETQQRFSDLVGAELELAFRKAFFQRDLAAPGVVTELIALVMEAAEDDPELRAAIGSLFIVAVGVAKAFERAHGLADKDIPKSSIGEAIEARTGRPLPKVGRNEPCVCGSGRKFKKCCGQWQEPPPLPAKSHAEQLFSRYISTVDLVWAFLHESKRDRDAQWVRKRSENFEERFAPGADGGVPDSMHLNYILFDLRIPRSGKTMGELFLEHQGHGLDQGHRTRLRELCESYPAFYELIALLPGETGKKRLRELGSGTEWLVNEVEDAAAEIGEPGEVWLCRLVGPRADAVTFMTPLIYPPDMRKPLEGLVRAFVDRGAASGLPIAEAIPVAMKQAGEALAEVVIETAPDAEDESDEDEGQEEFDEDDGDDAEGELTRGLPQLSNTDGEPLLPTKLLYDIDCARDAFGTLRDLAGPDGVSDDEVEWAADGSLVRARIAWLNPDGILPGGTVRGRFCFEPDQLIVDVNSAERAEQARVLIAERLGSSARLRHIKQEPLEAALQQAMADPDWPAKARAGDEKQIELFQENPGLRREMEDYLNGYYQGWLDRPLPVLNGKTPRAAVATKAGRKQVRALLEDIEIMDAARPPEMPRVDVASLRRELGLDR